MELSPLEIYEEYKNAVDFKASLGQRGMFEQNKINERFYIGDQWHGAKCGNDRPLVRHNVIKRIGDYKMAQVLSRPVRVSFSADGLPNTVGLRRKSELKKSNIANDPSYVFDGENDTDEINIIMSALGDYQRVTAERVGLDALESKALRDAYVKGSSVIYTYWDSTVSTGLYADEKRSVPIKGDISCEVLDIENVFFADPYVVSAQEQPYIIISSTKNADDVLREARLCGIGREDLRMIKEDARDGKVTVLTRLYKEYKRDGSYTIKCKKTTRRAVVRAEYDTGLRRYPLAFFSWENRGNLIYGESEVTYLIPNQIAINRMITANVWASMVMGMPMMVVNGDTVTDDITNEPGQIIKVFGSNEDVAGAVKYISPPEFGANYTAAVSRLIENTLTQSGANEVALGDSRPDNAAALNTMRDAAIMPLQIIKNKFYAFVEEISRIWADFWVTQYGNRRIKISDENGVWYMPFNADRYTDLLINANVDVAEGTVYSESDSVNTLLSLYEKGIITAKQVIKRLPDGILPQKDSLIYEEDIE